MMIIILYNIAYNLRTFVQYSHNSYRVVVLCVAREKKIHNWRFKRFLSDKKQRASIRAVYLLLG